MPITFDNESYLFISKLLNSYTLPSMAKVHQSFDDQRILDVKSTLIEELKRPAIQNLLKKVHKGDTVAITSGSRQLRNIVPITATLVDEIKKIGGNPYIIPSMGSHGGATAKGQRELIESFGITEEAMNCPIISDMATVKVGTAPDGKDVYIDKNAARADHVIVMNRIKPHTCFHGNYESGLMKMMAIGLGKQHGAEICHDDGFGKMSENIKNFGKVILENVNILMGIGLVENAYDQTCIIKALTPDEIPIEEPKLLEIARSRMPRIIIPECDILIVDRMGKNYSGGGMDPNVTGRFVTPYAKGGIKAQRVAVLDLSDEAHGNCIGVGCADVTTKRLYDKANPALSYINGMTSLVILGTKMPMVMMNDRDAILACLRTCTGIDRNRPRIVRIANTLQISDIYVSEALKDEVERTEGLEFISDFKPFDFDEDNNLPYFS
ncbi:MAG: lactate racemase domain-containing protein [Sphaerochaetaceae bacterium]|nr:lactate racemase domain-containing protein [Sphaerochaetaceae bacterium]